MGDRAKEQSGSKSGGCCAPFRDKSNGDGVETENSVTLGVIGVDVSGPEEATSGVAEILPVERQPLQV